MRGMARQELPAEKSTGRESQKHRTRKALVDAAEALLRAGGEPTVTDAAEAAGISRATAYRYFPTQDLLLAEVSLFAAGGPLAMKISADTPLPDAIADLVRRVATWSYKNEQPLRTLFRLSLDPSTGIRRPGHRNSWIASALEPVRDRMDPKVYDHLSKSLTLMMGIDPVVTMTDIAGATQHEAIEALAWSARALVEAALKTKSARRAG
jgi:AcrR family transcriptional regulator